MEKVVFVALALLCSLLTGCAPEKPAIPEADFVAILKDYHVAAGYSVSLVKVNRTDQDTLLTGHYKFVLQTRGYTVEQFRATMKYYEARPKAFELVYDMVIQQLTLEQEVLGKLPQEPEFITPEPKSPEDQKPNPRRRPRPLKNQ